MRFRPLLLTALRVVTASLMLPTLASAAGTPAGTSIVNQASGTYTEPDSGLSTQVGSNVAVTTVQAVCALSVSPDGTPAQPARSVALLPGEGAALPYTLVNAGNAAHTLALSARVEPGSAASPALRIVLDSNQDGQPGAGEPQPSSLTLAADASAALLLVVDAAQTPGDVYVNLVAACPGGQSDGNNVSRVSFGAPPEFQLDKTFTPALVRPGSETSVTLSASNAGAGASREVVLSDLLETQAAAGLSFVPGSAVASAGILEYSADGAVWAAVEPNPVRGVRVRVDSLAPGAALRLSFRMLAGAAAEGREIGNTATLRSGGALLSASASADVRYLPAVAIGPRGAPEAPEGSAEDTQTRPFAAVTQPVCFDHTVKNTGDVQDAFTISVAAPQASATLSGAGGAPLAPPLELAPGQSAEVRVCYQAAEAGALSALVTVTGARGTSNTTRDQVARVEGGLPELRKSALLITSGPDGRPEVVPGGGTVAQGDTVEYTLSVRNPYPFALTNVRLTDAVPAQLDVVSSAPGVRSGAPGQEQVVWTLASLAPGETRAVTLLTRISPRALDGESLSNTFSFRSAEVPGPLTSNEVLVPVWSAKLLVAKAVGTREVTYGDRVSYTLRISNTSTTTDVLSAVIADTPMAGLEYVPGTSTLDGQPLADPSLAPTAPTPQPGAAQSGTTMRWSVPTLKAGSTITLAYQLRVTPAARGELDNVVEVSGVGAGKANRLVASNRARATVRLNPLKFAQSSDIVGTVYVDRNRNGLYDEGLDTPLARARLLLAGGRQAITDARGRYSFLNVAQGTQALRLDPGTSPYAPLHVARDGGLSGTQTVFANGLTSVDFPLAPLGGDVTALRRTTLLIGQAPGEVRVDKSVYAVPGGYLVTLRITAPQALEGAELTDPLPAGARLKEGRNTLTGTLSAGEHTLTYRFAWDGEPRLATTDPELTWRP